MMCWWFWQSHTGPELTYAPYCGGPRTGSDTTDERNPCARSLLEFSPTAPLQLHPRQHVTVDCAGRPLHLRGDTVIAADSILEFKACDVNPYASVATAVTAFPEGAGSPAAIVGNRKNSTLLCVDSTILQPCIVRRPLFAAARPCSDAVALRRRARGALPAVRTQADIGAGLQLACADGHA
jgi:hypothetical protein